MKCFLHDRNGDTTAWRFFGLGLCLPEGSSGERRKSFLGAFRHGLDVLISTVWLMFLCSSRASWCWCLFIHHAAPVFCRVSIAAINSVSIGTRSKPTGAGWMSLYTPDASYGFVARIRTTIKMLAAMALLLMDRLTAPFYFDADAAKSI